MGFPTKVKIYRKCTTCKFYKFDKINICTKDKNSILTDLIACIDYKKSITPIDKMIKSSNKCIKIIDKIERLIKEFKNESICSCN